MRALILFIIMNLFASSFENHIFPHKEKNELIKAFHIDNGRKFFSLEQLKDMIDTLKDSQFNAIEFALGNDGLRFVVDDMALQVGPDHKFTSEQVKEAINLGNKAYCDCSPLGNELTQAHMDELVNYARERGIMVIPLVNTPGHMHTIISACSKLLGFACGYNGSGSTLDLLNGIAVDFVYKLVDKYVQYFKGKTKYFHMGGDESAFTDGASMLEQFVNDSTYPSFIAYLNQMAKQVKAAGLVPVAFNDGFFFRRIMTDGALDKDILVSYWTAGGDRLFPAKELKDMGYKIFNTNAAWYYVITWGETTFQTNTLPGIRTNTYEIVSGSGPLDVEGAMICFWCDNPRGPYDEGEQSRMKRMIQEFRKVNAKIFPQ